MKSLYKTFEDFYNDLVKINLNNIDDSKLINITYSVDFMISELKDIGNRLSIYQTILKRKNDFLKQLKNGFNSWDIDLQNIKIAFELAEKMNEFVLISVYTNEFID